MTAESALKIEKSIIMTRRVQYPKERVDAKVTGGNCNTLAVAAFRTQRGTSQNMAEPLFHRGPGRIFRRLGTRAQVVLCQLPLTLIVAAISVATPFAWPSLMHSPVYMAGIVLNAILFLGCCLIPWERLAHRP